MRINLSFSFVASVVLVLTVTVRKSAAFLFRHFSNDLKEDELTATFVKMDSSSATTARYTRIRWPPKRFRRYSGIVYTCMQKGADYNLTCAQIRNGKRYIQSVFLFVLFSTQKGHYPSSNVNGSKNPSENHQNEDCLQRKSYFSIYFGCRNKKWSQNCFGQIISWIRLTSRTNVSFLEN